MTDKERREHLVGLLLPMFLGRMVSYERGGKAEAAAVVEADALAARVMDYMDRKKG